MTEGVKLIKVTHGSKIVAYRNITARIHDRCLLCGDRIVAGEEIALVFTENNDPFPNGSCHKKCMQPRSPFDKNDPYVWTTGQLAKSWKEAQNYKQWFTGRGAAW